MDLETLKTVGAIAGAVISSVQWLLSRAKSKKVKAVVKSVDEGQRSAREAIDEIKRMHEKTRGGSGPVNR